MGTGTARGDEAVQEAVRRAVRNDHLDRTPARELPLPEHEAAAGTRSALAPAEMTGEQRRDGRDVGHSERDVIEPGFHYGVLR